MTPQIAFQVNGKTYGILLLIRSLFSFIGFVLIRRQKGQGCLGKMTDNLKITICGFYFFLLCLDFLLTVFSPQKSEFFVMGL